MKLKQTTFALLMCTIFSSAVFAEDHSASENVDNVKFEEHFDKKTYDGDTKSSHAGKTFLYTMASLFGSAGAGIVSENVTGLSRKRVAYPAERKSLLKKAARYDKLSKTLGVAGIYFVADGATGLIIAMNDHKPIFAANLPALAGYLARETAENIPQMIKNMPPAARTDLEILKKSILGKQKE